MKDKERLRNCHRSEDTKETYDNHMQCGTLEGIQEQKMIIRGKTNEVHTRSII